VREPEYLLTVQMHVWTVCRANLSTEICAMQAQQEDALELIDLGNVSEETKQHWLSYEFPDYFFSRGPFPAFLEPSA
jgi:hypothetical protein